jgi:glycosyltransferase involved in cell wall biosynthesis
MVAYPGGQTRVDQDGSPAGASSGKPYILSMGALALNKNVDGLLRVFSHCIHQYKLDINLVLTGNDFMGLPYWEALIQKLDLAARVSISGWVSEPEKEKLLQNAAMLWQFSWYEGFGFPVLEAASRGIPVLYSNRGALPEILESPEQQIDPEQEEAAAATAANAFRSPETLRRWRENGRKRAELFSWEKTSTALWDFICRQVPVI